MNNNIIIRHKISPNYDSSKLEKRNFEDFVDIFEDRMKGWMLDWAEFLNEKESKYEHAGFAVLHIGFSYFESIAIFIKGKSSKFKSEKFFAIGFKEVFSEELKNKSKEFIEDFTKIMYSQGRCGFYHSGMAKKEIGLCDGNLFTPIEKNGRLESILIDRYKFIGTIKHHLDIYIAKLRSSKEKGLKEKFLQAWNIFHSL